MNSPFIILYLCGIPNLMDQFSLKIELLSSCLTMINNRAESLRRVMEDTQQSANDYGQPKDRYDSYRTQLLRKRDMLGQQLQKILEQRAILERVNPQKQCDKVEFGSLVITSKQNIYITVGLGKLEHNGEEYFVISPAVPFYKAMEGNKTGDSFEFRGQKFKIEQIT